jgi:hypothetical protein
VAPVDLVTIHHEGSLANGGAPSDDVGRFKEGGYCCGIGANLYERWRAPADNWATLNYNGEDWTPCYSGDHHTGTALRAQDIDLLHLAYMDAYTRGEVTAAPVVRAHRNSPGSATACPGDFTIERWDDVVAACRPGPSKPPPDDEPSGRSDDMLVIAVPKAGAAANEQPYGFLDPVARKVWSHWGFRIAWDGGGGGDATLHGDSAPRYMNVPGGDNPLVGWAVLDDDGVSKKVCAYGLNGAEYTGRAHA